MISVIKVISLIIDIIQLLYRDFNYFYVNFHCDVNTAEAKKRRVLRRLVIGILTMVILLVFQQVMLADVLSGIAQALSDSQIITKALMIVR